MKENCGIKPVRLAYDFVSKRNIARFFVVGRQRGAQNAPSGTVVEDVVAFPNRQSFFLAAQRVYQPTATPTKCKVILDAFGGPPDELRQMTYIMRLLNASATLFLEGKTFLLWSLGHVQ